MSKIKFNSMMSNYEVINPEFARVKVYVCYDGDNRNRSNISKDVLNEMSKTIYGVPVVAEYDKDNECFKGHGGKLEITDDDMQFIQTTIPYGFVDPNTPIFYEKVTELDGMTVNEYMCCYAFLWYKRYPEIEKVLKNQDNKAIGQSMEIEIDDYTFSDDGIFVVKKAHFSALCMLGVEPCFESAKVTSKFTKEDSEKEYKNMVDTFKMYAVSELGGESVMEKEFEEVVEGTEPIVEPIVEEIPMVEEVAEVVEEVIEEDYQVKFNDSVKEIEALKSELVDFKSVYSELEVEVVALREFKLNIEDAKTKETIDAIITNEFSALQEVEGFTELTMNKYELKEEELRIKLKVFAYDNNISLGKKASFNKKNKEPLSIPLDNNKDVIESDPYGGILDKFIK